MKLKAKKKPPVLELTPLPVRRAGPEHGANVECFRAPGSGGGDGEAVLTH